MKRALRRPDQFPAVHKAADYFEPLFRARVARALRALRASVRATDIAIAIAHKSPAVVHVKPDLAPAARVVVDAFRQGGKIGAQKVKALR